MTMTTARMRDAHGDGARGASLALTLRPATVADEPFLDRVFASTRAEEMALAGWPAELTDVFLRSQADLQRRSYRAHHPDALDQVVMHGGTAAGRLFVGRSAEAVSIVDIALLPEHRGQGVGTRLIRDLQAEASVADLPVRLHVERGNGRARCLYERLGFAPIGGDDLYLAMEWRQATVDPAARQADAGRLAAATR